MIPKRIASTLDECIVGFFTDNGVAAVTTAEVAQIHVGSSTSVVATLGFTGDLVRGSLLVVAKAESLQMSHPMSALGADVKETDVNDWSGEIANQVLGRLKNGLLKYALNLKMSVPSVVRGASLQIVGASGSECLLRAARGSSGLVFGFALTVAFVHGFDPRVIDSMEPLGGTSQKEGAGFFF